MFSLSGVFNERFMPLEVYVNLISYSLPSSYSLAAFLDDKNLYRSLFYDYHLPERLVECASGVYYLPQESKIEVPFESVVEYCLNIKNVIIKPSKNSCAGTGVKLLNCKDGISEEGESIESILKKYGSNFCVERIIEESDNLSLLNPSSCNTVRIHTWRNQRKGQIEYVSARIRIGRKNELIDNSAAGGISCKILDDGTLDGNACTCTPYKKINETDNGITIQGYKIINFDKMVQIAVEAHSRLPFFKLIGWDFCTDKQGEPIIIEYNPDPDLRMEQLVYNDSCLQDRQEEIIRQVYNTN